MPKIISKTGKQHGYGTAKYKWVSGLTKAERDAVRDGKKVYITGSRPAGGNHGTTMRLVRYYNGRYLPRVP
jgi:hypothetical protein